MDARTALACPYYAGTGDLKCASGCRTEPACVTEEPTDGWKVPEASAVNDALAYEKLIGRHITVTYADGRGLSGILLDIDKADTPDKAVLVINTIGGMAGAPVSIITEVTESSSTPVIPPRKHISRDPITLTLPHNQVAFLADLVGGTGDFIWGHLSKHHDVTDVGALYDALNEATSANGSAEGGES
ncbi:hypothetical protein [Actinomadura rugatobispora]|uniref:PRC-barrel domain containing protein n=1 Tax=Actinomadura rugatobispora TaxID=1994 RepID=A0ABW0ZQX0_9ACTN|nr:hypothetical protein GCM10010200_036090 [Actinomadura rugatobispora]